MRRSLTWSAALHLLVVVLAVLGLPRLWERTEVPDAPMIVEVVKIDEQTTAKDQPKRAEKKEAEKKTPPPPPAPPRAADRPPPPAPPEVAERPAPEAEKVPVIPKTTPKKTEEKPKKQPETKAPPRAIAKARPKRRPLPPKDDFLQSVLRDVSPEERGEKPTDKPDKTPPKPAPQEKVVENRAPLDAVATVSEIDAIRHRIEQCWVIPAGARDADKLVVSIRVWVNPDGTVRDAQILNRERMSDPFFRSAAESAYRAVRNPRCSPLPIPPKKYDQFKEMVLDFNPKEAAGS